MDTFSLTDSCFIHLSESDISVDTYLFFKLLKKFDDDDRLIFYKSLHDDNVFYFYLHDIDDDLVYIGYVVKG